MGRARVTDRRSLYELVWSEPIVKLAPRYGVSDRGLAKICEAHDIPVPPRGYWAKVAAGEKPRKPILKKRTDGRGERVVIGASKVELPASVEAIAKKRHPSKKRKVVQETASKVEEPYSDLSEDTEVTRPVVKTVKYLLSKQPDKKGTIKANNRGMCGIIVNQVQAKRAANVLHLFANEVEARGLILLPVDTHMTIKNEDAEVDVSLSEKSTMQMPEPKPTTDKGYQHYWDELDRIKKQYAGVIKYGRWAGYREVWSGQLSFSIDAWTSGLRKTWSDGKKQRVENCISEVVTGIEMVLEQKRLDQIKNEEQKAWWAEEETRRQKERQRQALEKRRLEGLSIILQAKKEADELENWLRSLNLARRDIKDLEYVAMVAWAKERVVQLKDAAGVDAALAFSKERGLFDGSDDSHSYGWFS